MACQWEVLCAGWHKRDKAQQRLTVAGGRESSQPSAALHMLRCSHAVMAYSSTSCPPVAWQEQPAAGCHGPPPAAPPPPRVPAAASHPPPAAAGTAGWMAYQWSLPNCRPQRPRPHHCGCCCSRRPGGASVANSRRGGRGESNMLRGGLRNTTKMWQTDRQDDMTECVLA